MLWSVGCMIHGAKINRWGGSWFCRWLVIWMVQFLIGSYAGCKSMCLLMDPFVECQASMNSHGWWVLAWLMTSASSQLKWYCSLSTWFEIRDFWSCLLSASWYLLIQKSKLREETTDNICNMSYKYSLLFQNFENYCQKYGANLFL